MEPRIPPKFVPTLTEVAAQDGPAESEENWAVAHAGQAPVATELIAIGATAPAPASADVLRRRREAGSGDTAAAPADVDIANLRTHSGWAQSVDAPTPLVPASTQTAQVEGAVSVVGVAADAAQHSPSDAAAHAAAASLVASAAQTAQELEDAITRRVLKRVQQTLDARLTSAVLKVVEQQTALLQSSLQLEIDATIREAVADMVAKVLHADPDTSE